MTKQEIRILTLAKARIAPDSVVIDIGAGTGSLSVEAALQAPHGHVYAIERELEGIALIKINSEKFGAANVTPVFGTAPEALATLPPADVILIGGSGGKLEAIIAEADRLLKPGGRLVITAITIETLYHGLRELEARSYRTETCGVQVNRVRTAGASHMFQALNPVYIMSSTKEDFHDR